MTVLTPREIGILIYKNELWGPGGSDAAVIRFLDNAIAVAYGESGWDTDAKNRSSSASGLYQILVSVHGDKIKGRDIFDPAVNVDVARLVWEGAGKSWQPWTAYTAKSAKFRAGQGHGKPVFAWLQLATEEELGKAYAKLAGRLVPGGAAVSAVADVSNSSLVGSTLAFLRDAGIAVGVFILGIILVILGTWFLLSQSKTGRKVVRTAKKAAPKVPLP